MDDQLSSGTMENQSLQDRIIELEQQLAKAQEIILNLSSPKETGKQEKDGQEYDGLHEREARFQLLAGDHLNAFAIFSVIPDKQGKVSDFQVKHLNAAAFALTGRKRGDTLGKTVLEIYPGFEQTDIFRWCAQVFETGKSISREGYALDTSFCGRLGTRYFNFRIFRLGNQLSLFWREVTERMQAAQSLRESEERFSKAFMAAPYALSISRISDGRIVEVNQSFERLFGYSREEVIGRTSLELGMFANPADRQAAIEQVREQGSLRDFELDIRTRNGEARPVSLSIERLNLDQEEHILTIIQDLTERKRVEAALRAKEREQRELAQSLDMERARLATILENLPVGVWIADQNGRLIGKNEQADRIWAGDAPLFGSIEEYPQYVSWHPDNGKILLPEEYPVAKALQTGQPVDPVELNIRRFDGTEGAVLVSAAPIPGPDGQLAGAVGVNVDITRRKRAEEMLRESEAMRRLALTAGRAGAWSWDLRANRLQWSDEYYRIFGFEPGSIQPSAEAGFSRVHPDDRPGIEALVHEAIERSKPIDQVHRVIWPDGSVHWVRGISQVFYDEQGQPYRMAGLAMDITEQKQAEIELEAAHRRAAEILESIRDAFYSLDHEGRFTYVNQIAASLWKMRPEDLLGKNIWEVFPTGKETESYEKIQQALKEGQAFHYESYSPFLKQWLNIKIFPNEHGVSVYFQDITERKRADEALAEFSRQIERSNRDLEQFAFVASHDLQEPLRKIEAFGDSLLQYIEQADDRARLYAERMRNAAGRMRGMVDGLLQLSRINTQGQPFSRVDLSKAVADVLSDLEYQVRRTGGRVEISALPEVEGDPLQIRQLLQNLIGNALKYHRPETPPVVKVHARQLSGRVKILVEDNGIGFNQNDADLMFQPFQRLVGRNQYEGSGMGLAICRRIVERHGGEISAHGEHGKGSTFIVTLPVIANSTT